MRKSLLWVAVIAALFTGCSDDQNQAQEQDQQIDMSDFYVYTDSYETGTADRVADGKTVTQWKF
jgi:uncharacterized protein YcfL